MSSLTFRGTFTALVTPFSDDGRDIDWSALERLVEDQLLGGVSGVVPCGTTGEAPTLSASEKRAVFERVVASVRGRVPVLAGTGTNNTEASVQAAREAEDVGADAVMVVMPYYSRPSQEGLVRHIEAVAEAVRLPIVLYNIPVRTGVELSVDSTLRVLDNCRNVMGVKDATGGVSYCQELVRRAGDRACVMSGDDPLTLPLMSVGATGVISVTSNVYPAQVSALTRAALAGDYVEARKRHLGLLPVHRALFLEPNPGPTKAALALAGKVRATVRLPLVAASDACRISLARVLADYEAL